MNFLYAWLHIDVSGLAHYTQV